MTSLTISPRIKSRDSMLKSQFGSYFLAMQVGKKSLKRARSCPLKMFQKHISALEKITDGKGYVFHGNMLWIVSYVEFKSCGNLYASRPELIPFRGFNYSKITETFWKECRVLFTGKKFGRIRTIHA